MKWLHIINLSTCCAYFPTQKTRPNTVNYLFRMGNSKSNEIISSKDDEVFRILWNAHLPINMALIVPFG